MGILTALATLVGLDPAAPATVRVQDVVPAINLALLNTPATRTPSPARKRKVSPARKARRRTAAASRKRNRR
jgi:hypothetical protein